jgi:hypothetical protein
MKNLLFSYIILGLLLSSCASNTLIHPVQQHYDEYKQEHITQYETHRRARSIRTNNLWRDVKLHFKKTANKKGSQVVLNLYTSAELNDELQDTLFFKINNLIYKVPFSKVSYTEEYLSNSSAETEIVKEKEDDDKEESKSKETITTTVNTYEHSYLKVAIKCTLPADVNSVIEQAERISIRYYDQNDAYTIRLGKNATKNIKKVIFGENNREIVSDY